MTSAPAPPLTDAELAEMDDDRLRGMIAAHCRQAAEYERCGWTADAAVQRGRQDRYLDEWTRRQSANCSPMISAAMRSSSESDTPSHSSGRSPSAPDDTASANC